MSFPRDPKSALAACAVVISRPVCWGDMDAFLHVNNTKYLRYFEDIRIAYFEHAGFMGDSPTDKRTTPTGLIGPILSETYCRFKAPLTYPDTVQIGTAIGDIDTDRFTMHYVVVSEALDRIAAVGHGLVVCYDYARASKTDLPEDWRRILETHSGAAS